MKLDEATVQEIKFTNINWVTKAKKPYIMASFVSNKHKNLVEAHKFKISKSYRPHGLNITIRKDLTADQAGMANAASDICNKLKNMGYHAYAEYANIRIGKKPKHKWHRFDSKAIEEMLNRPPTAVEAGNR